MWHAMTGRIPFEGCRDHCEVNKQAALNRANPAVATLLPLPDGTPRPLQLFLRTLWDEDVHQANLYPCAHAVRPSPFSPHTWKRRRNAMHVTARAHVCLMMCTVCLF